MQITHYAKNTIKEFCSFKDQKNGSMEATQISKRFCDVILDGLWIANTNYMDQLSDLTWQQAMTKIGDLNTIAALTFHVNYYVAGVLQVFEDGTLTISDRFSFDAPTITSQNDWEQRVATLKNNAEKFSDHVSKMSDEQLEAVFVDEKYGTYQRNIEAMIEHSYYHLGQITLIKKLVLAEEKA